jgi:hypothetical protein
MMQMPGQMRPDMPNIPQIKPSGMGQAAALPSEVEQLKRLPREQLMQALMSPAEEPPKWAVVTALDQQGKEADLKERAEGAAAQRQVAGLGTVAQEVATRPFARGGVVGFDKGGLLKDPLFDTFLNYLRSLKEASEAARETSTYGGGRGTQRRSSATVTTPTAPTVMDYDPAADVKREERRLLDRRPAPSSTAPASTPSASTVPANNRGLGTGKPQRTPPPADTTPPPQTDGFDIKDLQGAIRAAGTVSPEIQTARDALRTQREASLSARERRRAGLEAELSEKPSMGLAAAQIAAAMAGSNRLGEALARGAGAVANLQGAETKRLRELRRELMTMEDAEDSLREALAEKALAERSGDDAARKAADVKVFEAQRDYLDKQRTFRIQEQEAQARMTAAERSGSSGGDTRGLNVQVTALRALIDSAQKEIDSGLLNDAQRAAAIKRKADAERQLAAIAAGFSNVSTEDLLKTLGVTGGAKQ